jgi:redox-sensitive bicupin YhaK (pirin superfamily)
MRTIKEIVAAEAVREGAGVIVHRPFPTRHIDNIDPFLLLDHMGPNVYAPGSAKGFPDHPHRGFETVSYMLEGALEHRDSAGNKGVIAAGDVQWMTAGSGVVHSEMPEENFREQGGRLNGFQLWVNLPKSDKMTAPRYQDTLSANIPVYESEDKSVWVKVIAGNSMGKEAVISTHIPILY